MNIKAQEANDESITKDYNYEVSLGYWAFDGLSNYGASLNRPKLWDKWGMDMNIRSSFDKYSNYSADLGFSYTYDVWKYDNTSFFLTGSAGPSIRSQKYADVKYDINTGKISNNIKSKFFVDLFLNARASFKMKRVIISIGYFLWDAEFNLNSDYMNSGVVLSAGISY